MIRVMLHSLLSVTVLAFFAGCTGDQTQSYNEAEKNVDTGGHDHDHGHEGPHGGHVIEIGEEVAHVEVKMADNRTITFFVLGPDVETAVPVAVEDILFELEGEGDEEIELELTPTPLAGEQEGHSSVFIVKGEIVPEAIVDIEKLHGHVHITIDGTPYEGHLKHDHGDEGDNDHDHADGDHDHDDKDKAPEKEKDAE